jgi:hypothetical protein
MTYGMTYSSLVGNLQDYTSNYTNTNYANQIPQLIFNAELRISRELKSLEGKVVVVSNFQQGLAVYPKPGRWRTTISMNYASTATLYQVATRTNNNGSRTLTLSTPQDVFVAGSVVEIFNVGGSGYNGTFTLTGASQLSVSYTAGSGSEGVTADNGLVTPVLQSYTPIYPRTLEYCREYWPDLTQTGQPLFYGDFDYNNIIIVPTPIAAMPYQMVYYETVNHLGPTNQTNWMTLSFPDMLLYGSLWEAAVYLKDDDAAKMYQDLYTRAGGAQTTEAQARAKDAVDDGSIGR